MYSEVVWALVPSGTQVQPKMILDPNYLPDYLSISRTMVFMTINFFSSKARYLLKQN